MLERRTFLRGLASLPLIGGGVTLIGNPTAAAVPVTPALLERYSEWLAIEYGETIVEQDAMTNPARAALAMQWRREWCRDNRTLNPYPDSDRFVAAPLLPPSFRAAVVLSAVGVPLA